jgi:hypothetical protein
MSENMSDEHYSVKAKEQFTTNDENLAPLLQKSLDLTALNQKMSALVAKGESIKVCDQMTDLDAKQFELEVKSYEKAVDLYADGDIQDATERLNRLRIAKMKLLQPLVLVRDKVRGIRKAWEEGERRAAEAEEKRLQDEAQKAREKEVNAQLRKGEIGKREAEQMKLEVPKVTVKPSIPTMQGVQSRRNWTFEIVDARLIPDRFWVVDSQAIGRMVRETKDKALAEKTCPGIIVRSE